MVDSSISRIRQMAQRHMAVIRRVDKVGNKLWDRCTDTVLGAFVSRKKPR